MSSYLEFARIIKVEAICRSFNAIYNYDQNSNEVFGHFNELLMEEEGYLPDELGGVESEGRVVGWFDYTLETNQDMSISEVMEPIELKYVFSAETDILTTLESVSKFVQNVYFVNKGNKIIGYFFFEDLLGDHLSIDLLSLVLDFEKICLKICCLDPEDNFNNLSKSIKNNIMGKYFKRGLLLKDGEIPYYVKTMELTSLKEKMIILSNNPNLILFLPAINDQKFIEITYDLRNNVVHPEESDSLTKLFTKQDLWKYIVRLKALTLALKQYYELVKKDDQESEALFEITD